MRNKWRRSGGKQEKLAAILVRNEMKSRRMFAIILTFFQ